MAIQPTMLEVPPSERVARERQKPLFDEIADQHYGGRGYACADPEGHAWWFGSYDPWKEASA